MNEKFTFVRFQSLLQADASLFDMQLALGIGSQGLSALIDAACEWKRRQDLKDKKCLKSS